MWTATRAAHELGLGPGWAAVLVRELPDPGPSGRWALDVVLGWLRGFILATDPITVADLRAATSVVTGRTPPGDHRARRIALAVALRYTTADGGYPALIARSGRTPPRLVELGPPDAETVRELREARLIALVEPLWEAALPRAEIAARARLGATVTERVIATFEHRRLFVRDITERFGWSPENLRLRRLRSTFPPPDGRDQTRPWWWAETVDDWARSQNLVTCSECGARVVRLRPHQTRHRNQAG